MLDNKTKERIKLEAAFKSDDGMAHWSPMKAYIAGAEAEATRAAGLYDCLLKIRHNHYTENAVDKKIDEALTNYNNPVNK